MEFPRYGAVGFRYWLLVSIRSVVASGKPFARELGRGMKVFRGNDIVAVAFFAGDVGRSARELADRTTLPAPDEEVRGFD